MEVGIRPWRDQQGESKGRIMNVNDRDRLRKRLENLAMLMDNSIPLPGLKTRVGIDPLIGLLPWFGDAIGALISSYIIAAAARLGAPKAVLIKMAFNVTMDAFIGAIPGIGDLFDFAWKANSRNVRLLEHYVEQPHRTAVTSRLFVVALSLLLIGTIVFIGFLAFLLFRWLWSAVTSLPHW